MANRKLKLPDVDPKMEMKTSSRSMPPTGGEKITISGNTGPGASIGRGSVASTHIARSDLAISTGDTADVQTQFADLLDDLKELILQAEQKGELDGVLAKQAVKHVETATDIAKKEEKINKASLIKELETVANMIEVAAEKPTTNDASVATILGKALPIAFLLVKLAARLF